MTNQGRHGLDVAHTVDTHREKVAFLEGADKLLDVLSQHVMSVGCRYRETQHDRHFRSDALGFLEGDACVLRIKNSLYQQHIDTSVYQRLYLFRIGLTESGGKVLFIISLLTDEGLARRSDASCYKTRFLWRGIFLGTLACYLDCSQVDFPAIVLQVEVAHRDTLGIEGVSLDDVCTSCEVFAMDVSNDVRCGEAENVVTTFEILKMIGEARTTEVFFLQMVLLNHGAHSTVKNKDAVGGEGGTRWRSSGHGGFDAADDGCDFGIGIRERIGERSGGMEITSVAVFVNDVEGLVYFNLVMKVHLDMDAVGADGV